MLLFLIRKRIVKVIGQGYYCSEQGWFRGLDDYHVLHSPLYTTFFLPMMLRPGTQAVLFPVPAEELFRPFSQAHSSEITFIRSDYYSVTDNTIVRTEN